MVDFYIFTRQTGSLRQKPGRYGSPGRAVMVQMKGELQRLLMLYTYILGVQVKLRDYFRVL